MKLRKVFEEDEEPVKEELEEIDIDDFFKKAKKIFKNYKLCPKCMKKMKERGEINEEELCPNCIKKLKEALKEDNKIAKEFENFKFPTFNDEEFKKIDKLMPKNPGKPTIAEKIRLKLHHVSYSSSTIKSKTKENKIKLKDGNEITFYETKIKSN